MRRRDYEEKPGRPIAFGAWLDLELDRKGWRPVDLATAMGVYQSLISKWRNDSQLPRFAQMQSISNALEVPLDEVLRAAGHNVGPESPSALYTDAINLLGRVPDDLLPLAIPTLEVLADPRRRGAYRNAVALSARMSAESQGPEDGPQPGEQDETEPTRIAEADAQIPKREVSAPK